MSNDDICNDYIPHDWSDPNWSTSNRVHEWKNHVSSDIRKLWDSFTDQQKQVLASYFQREASNEVWD